MGGNIMNFDKKWAKDVKSVAIGGHIHPDGDCVGSCTALALYIKKSLPEVEVTVYLEDIPTIFDQITKGISFEHAIEENKIYDEFYCLDCASDRLGFSKPLYDIAKKRINVDHHITNTGSGDENFIDDTAAATAEILFSLFDKEKLDINIAQALYVGIIHDTGVFQYSNTSSKTLEAGALLISYKFDFPTLIEETFYQKTFLQAHTLGVALLKAEKHLEGMCVSSYIDQAFMKEEGITTQDFDGIVNQLRNITGVECAIFIYEQEDGNKKVSLRATDRVNVAEIAASFGGGGHKKAAGCSIPGDIESIKERIISAVAKELEKN